MFVERRPVTEVDGFLYGVEPIIRGHSNTEEGKGRTSTHASQDHEDLLLATTAHDPRRHSGTDPGPQPALGARHIKPNPVGPVF